MEKTNHNTNRGDDMTTKNTTDDRDSRIAAWADDVAQEWQGAAQRMLRAAAEDEIWDAEGDVEVALETLGSRAIGEVDYSEEFTEEEMRAALTEARNEMEVK